MVLKNLHFGNLECKSDNPIINPPLWRYPIMKYPDYTLQYYRRKQDILFCVRNTTLRGAVLRARRWWMSLCTVYCVLQEHKAQSTGTFFLEKSLIGVVVKSALGSHSIFSSVTFMREIRFHVKRSHEVIKISWLLLTCSEMKWLPFQFHDELR